MAPAYVTEADFVERYGVPHAIRVTNLDFPGATTINQDVLRSRIDEVNAVISGFVQHQNLSGVPVLLKTIGVRLLNRFLYQYEVPEAVLAEGNWAMAMLRDIASGRIRLDDSLGEVESQGSPQYYEGGGGEFYRNVESYQAFGLGGWG